MFTEVLIDKEGTAIVVMCDVAAEVIIVKSDLPACYRLKTIFHFNDLIGRS